MYVGIYIYIYIYIVIMCLRRSGWRRGGPGPGGARRSPQAGSTNK